MQTYLQKFDKIYKGKQCIDIEFFNDKPLTIKYARYNQSGEVCYCMANSNTANQKTKNGWQSVQCNSNCQYRQKNEFGKSACNRIGWLKFFIPSVCKDRIFLMRITGQTSLNRLDDYFNLQRVQGNTIKGQYTLFLKQEEQSNSLGKTFNNYVLDILKKDDFISQESIPQNNNRPKENYICNDQNINKKVVNNDTKKENIQSTSENNVNLDNVDNVTTEKNTKKDISKEKIPKGTKSKSKKSENTEIKAESNLKENKISQEKSLDNENLDNCYALLSTFNETIANKEYLIGEFTDMNDKICNIAIRPEDAEELAKCDLGTFVRLDVSERKGRKFAIKLEFIEKTQKKVVA